MSVLSQLGMAALIVSIIFILIRSNRQLVKAAQEGEQFVDEWALREQKRQELLAFKEQRGKAEAEEPVREETAAQMQEMQIPDNVIPIRREQDPDLDPVDMVLTEFDEEGRQIRSVPVRHLPFTIGRSPENDLVIDDLCIAKKHCQIVKRNQTVIMEDVGSRNKIAVGGSLSSQAVLTDHLMIGIGNREFMVTVNGLTGERV